MRRIPIAYVAALVAFCLADFTWLGFVAIGFYRAQIGPLLAATPNWVAAVLFYPLFVAGIVYFCVAPALHEQAWTRALGRGMLFGLVGYATYDLTNLATLAGWPLTVTIVDITWGMAVSGFSATIGYLAASSRST